MSIYQINNQDGSRMFYRTSGNIKLDGEYIQAQTKAPLSKFEQTFESYFKLFTGENPKPSQVAEEV
ncbi:MAG: hypothetical protein WC645_00100 [Candidatus Margulisiibacteriota bacterium]